MSAYYSEYRKEMLFFLPKEFYTVLEIGCGEGFFSKNILNQTEYWGIEPNNSAANVAKKNINYVLVGKYDDVESLIPNNYFDLIICNDVIEHMNDYSEFLFKIKTKMKFNSVIIGSVPNVRYISNIFNYIFKKDWLYTNEGILDKTHLKFFTIKSLSRIFTETHYKIEIIKGINAIPVKNNFKLNIFKLLFATLCGSDSKYFQIGFRVRNSL